MLRHCHCHQWYSFYCAYQTENLFLRTRGTSPTRRDPQVRYESPPAVRAPGSKLLTHCLQCADTPEQSLPSMQYPLQPPSAQQVLFSSANSAAVHFAPAHTGLPTASTDSPPHFCLQLSLGTGLPGRVWSIGDGYAMSDPQHLSAKRLIANLTTPVSFVHEKADEKSFPCKASELFVCFSCLLVLRRKSSS